MELFYWSPLQEKYPNTDFFLVRIFPHSEIREVPNPGKYGPEKTPYFDTFHTVLNFNNNIKHFIIMEVLYRSQ